MPPKRGRRLLAAAVLAFFAPTLATAQDIHPYAHVGAFCTGSAVEVTVAGVDDETEPAVVGFDLFRIELGPCGTSAVRLTEVPIPRPAAGQFTLRFIDAFIDPGVLYEYRVIGVDAARSIETALSQIYPSSSTNDFFYASCGETFLGPGTLRDDGGIYSFASCPQSCLPILYVDPSTLSELAEHVDTPTSLRLSGRFFLAFGVPLLAPDAFDLRACGTSVESTTWTHLKQRYQ